MKNLETQLMSNIEEYYSFMTSQINWENWKNDDLASNEAFYHIRDVLFNRLEWLHESKVFNDTGIETISLLFELLKILPFDDFTYIKSAIPTNSFKPDFQLLVHLKNFNMKLAKDLDWSVWSTFNDKGAKEFLNIKEVLNARTHWLRDLLNPEDIESQDTLDYFIKLIGLLPNDNLSFPQSLMLIKTNS